MTDYVQSAVTSSRLHNERLPKTKGTDESVLC
jgi:hypothetical protein